MYGRVQNIYERNQELSDYRVNEIRNPLIGK